MPRLILAVVLASGFVHVTETDTRADDSPEARALRYLSAEVPRWSVEHRCFSCHNNGDAARALHAAIKRDWIVPDASTVETDRWLSRPEGWEKNGGDGPFSDKALARVQFSAALASALGSGRIKGRKPLDLAASKLAKDQAEDGSWRVDEQGRVGSPATYGRPLATWMAIESLRAADPVLYGPRIEKANAWLRSLKPVNTVDASASLLALDGDVSADGFKLAMDLIRKAQTTEGGWGPFTSSSPEAFDTALALLALDRSRNQAGVARMIERGRAYLVSIQQDEGSWVETTRPAGGESYAQRLSTTGWATLALLTVK